MSSDAGRIIRDVEPIDAADGDFIPRALRSEDGAIASASLALALAIRRVEDDEGDAAAWYELACEAFDAEEYYACESALDRCEALEGAYGRDARFALRRAHCALALGEDGDEATLGTVDRVFETLECCAFSSDVRAALALEATEIEEEWGRRCGRAMRERTAAERARAVETLGEDAFEKE